MLNGLLNALDALKQVVGDLIQELDMIFLRRHRSCQKVHDLIETELILINIRIPQHEPLAFARTLSWLGLE